MTPIDRDVLLQHRAADHLVVERAGGITARCSIWTDGTPALDGVPVGVVGHYAAASANDGERVLFDAVARLRAAGFSRVVGPMDGNTWRRYRLLTERGEVQPFFLEPDNADDWPAHFITSGFTPLAEFFSGASDDLSLTDPRVAEAAERFVADGVTFRQIDLSRLDAELEAVHALSLDAFADNFLYTPIARDEFVAMYAPIRRHLLPQLITLAERRGELVGFMFGVPDLAQAQRGRPVDTAIAKTIAVRPGRAGGGLGSVLMARFHDAALGLGFRRVIHALMHEGNRSRNLVARFGSRTIRRYTLYARATAP